MSEVVSLELSLRSGPLELLGPDPANLRRVEATRQNTLVLQDGQPVLVRPPHTAGGPDVWSWQLLNIGPGIVFARWDGLGYAAPNDQNSIQLVSGVGFGEIAAGVMTFACVGATQVTFSVDNLPHR